jgi:Flp pilus assembly protein TadD
VVLQPHVAPFADTLQAILRFFEDRTDSANAMLWFDIFVESQHADAGPSKSPQWYMTTFKDSIANIGRLLLVVDVWNNPTALRRAWCVLELHAIAVQKTQGVGEFAVAMTDEQEARFLQDIGDDIRQYQNMLSTIDVEKSDCSRRCDRDSIHEGIRATVGFAQLSRMVFGVLEERIRGQIETKALSCAESGNYMQAMQWNEILGVMMEKHGLVNQAIAIQERLLDLKRRVLPKHHPNSAATVCNLATSYIAHGRLDEAVEILEEAVFGRDMPEHHEHLGTAINNLGVAYSELGRHSDALVMRERALQFYRRNSPESDPQIGKAMNNLAHTYSNLGKLSNALSMQEKALQFYGRVLPENHPDVGMAISTLALLYSKLGRHN